MSFFEISGILTLNIQYAIGENAEMKAEVREINKMMCRGCSETDYEKCKFCKVYNLINSIAS